VSDIQKSIRGTIVYFDIFEYPLTSFEIYKYLWRPEQRFTLAQVNKELKKMVDEKILVLREGFFCLRGSEENKKSRNQENIKTRKKRYLIAQEKMKKARPYVKLISKIPFVKAIFICNNLGYLNAPDDSDIDLAIITSKNTIWTVRLLAVGLMMLFNKRPNERTQKDKICLSFYITEENLDMQSLAYENDIHFIYWLNQFMPVYGKQDLIDKFYKANSWIKEYLPNCIHVKTNRRWFMTQKNIIKKIFEILLAPRFINTWLEKIQLKEMPRHLFDLAWQENTDVVISNKILKFHDQDARLEVRDAWLEVQNYPSL